MATIKKSKITPFLWYNDNLEEAVKFYTSIFKKSKVLSMPRMGNGKVFTATFELEGQRFMGLNGGPQFKFNESLSFFVDCKTQKEVDYFWEKLSKGGEKSRCGWLKDKFGLSWQIVPEQLGKYLYGKDPVRAKRVMDAMIKMNKIEIKKLEEAYKGK
jgi:predicted 3-demethylubiquinone-9 3-methyltransferase (glyoxalase superfamily)